MKTSIRKTQWDALQEAMDGSGRVELDELARIFGADTKPTPSQSERQPDSAFSEDEEDGLYLEWAAMSGIAAPTVSPEEQTARAEFEVELAEVNAELEAEREQRRAAERATEEQVDSLYERDWKPRL